MLYSQADVGLTQVLFSPMDGFAAVFGEQLSLVVGCRCPGLQSSAALLGCCPAPSCAVIKAGAELRACVSSRNPALAFQMKRLNTLT